MANSQRPDMKDSEKYSVIRMEEIANCISHGAGFLVVLISAPLLILAAARHTAAVSELARVSGMIYETNHGR